MWPFRKEARQAESPIEFPAAIPARTTAAVDAYRALQLAVTEACVRLISDAASMARVADAGPAQGAITPEFLSRMVRFGLLRGEAVAEISVDDGMIRLLGPAQHHEIRGSADRAAWMYHVSHSGPDSGTRTVPLAADAVVHLRLAAPPEQPWQGVPVQTRARETFGTAAILDRAVAMESSGDVGRILSVQMPSTAADSQQEFDQHWRQLAALNGGTFLERQSRERGSGNSGYANLLHIGPAFSGEALRLRQQLIADICASYGTPPELIGYSAADGTGKRESYRFFILTTVSPIVRQLEHELRDKLDQAMLSLDLRPLRSADAQGIGRGIAALTSSGLSTAEALAIAGIFTGDE